VAGHGARVRKSLAVLLGLTLLAPCLLRARPAGLREDGKPYSILIINDRKALAREVGGALIKEGFTVAGYADGGWAGVNRYRDLRPRPDLVLIAVRMAPMDGATTLAKLRGIDGPVKTLMTCVAADEGLAKDAFLLGASDYLILPAERSLLLEKILTILRR
jgi:DNA-binding response OmpR family regulator